MLKLVAARKVPGKAFLLLLFVNFFLFAPVFAGEPGVIEGVVLNTDTDEPIAGANVIIEGSLIGAVSDLEGNFRLQQVPRAHVRLIVSHVGYRTDVRDADLKSTSHLEVEIKLAPTPFELNPVVVTGTRSRRYVLDSPVRTDVITAQDLEAMGVSNLYEALEASPGVRVEQQCQACNFTQVRMNGLGGDHTQILLDGQPVYTGLASVYGLQQFSTSEVDRIEVIRGAGSALYGSNAVAGAINIITERPTQDAIAARVEMGSHGTNQYDASAALVRNNTALRLFAQLNQEAAIDQTRDGNTRDEVYKSDGVSDRVEAGVRNVGAAAYRNRVLLPEDEVFVRFRFLNEVRKGGEITGDLFTNPYSAGAEHITTDRLSGTVGYRAQLSDNDGIEVQVTGVQHDRDATNDTYLNDYMDTHDGAMPDVDSFRPYMATEHLYLVLGNYNRRIADHQLSLGVQYSYDELEESGRYVVVDESDPLYGVAYTSIADKHAHDIGIYLQDEWRFARQWELVAGVRQDMHSSEDVFRAEEVAFSRVFESSTYDETSLSPRLALKYAPAQDWVLRLSYGTGFKVPYGFSEDLHLCSGSPRVWKGGGLKPESSQSVNASADYNAIWGTVGVNGYVTELTNAIGIMNAGDYAKARGYDFEYRNIDDAVIYGVDLNARVPLMQRLQVTGDLSWFNGEYNNVREDWIGTPYEDDSKYISRYPSLSGGLRLDYNPGKWQTTLDARYTGSMYIDYAEEDDIANPGSMVFETDPYVILNAQVSWQVHSLYKLYAGGRNLGDYIQPVKRTDDAAFFYAPIYGRIFYGGVRLEF